MILLLKKDLLSHYLRLKNIGFEGNSRSSVRNASYISIFLFVNVHVCVCCLYFFNKSQQKLVYMLPG